MLNNESDAFCFLWFQRFFFLSRFFLFDLLSLVSFDGLDLFDDESDDDRSGFGFAGTYAFLFYSDEYVGSVRKYVDSVSGVWSGVFVLT